MSQENKHIIQRLTETVTSSRPIRQTEELSIRIKKQAATWNNLQHKVTDDSRCKINNRCMEHWRMHRALWWLCDGKTLKLSLQKTQKTPDLNTTERPVLKIYVSYGFLRAWLCRRGDEETLHGEVRCVLRLIIFTTRGSRSSFMGWHNPRQQTTDWKFPMMFI